MLLKKGFKFRLDPTSGQEQLFAQFAGASRFLYNRGLEQRKTLYEKEGKSITYFEQNNELVDLKRQEATIWLQGIHSQVLQQALKNLDTAFKNFSKIFKLAENPAFLVSNAKGIGIVFDFHKGSRLTRTMSIFPKLDGSDFASPVKSKERLNRRLFVRRRAIGTSLFLQKENLRCLKYKAEEKGKHFVETGKYFPSTQTCCRCGSRKKMELKDREYECPHCSAVIERDLINQAHKQVTTSLLRLRHIDSPSSSIVLLWTPPSNRCASICPCLAARFVTC